MTQFTAATNFPRMAQILGVELNSDLDVWRIVRAGISAATYRRVAAKLRLPPGVVTSSATLRRRLGEGQRFTVDESERIVRLVRVYAHARGLLGDADATLAWFSTPAEFLPDSAAIAPMELAASENGARLLESRINRTAHGIP
jgi:putative toxin-antitoxin system antitoxin component (TIGR02293 family)